MTRLIPTDDVLAPHHLMELFACGPEDEYDGPDLDVTDAVPVCDGVWKLEPDGELWRFWKYPEEGSA